MTSSPSRFFLSLLACLLCACSTKVATVGDQSITAQQLSAAMQLERAKYDPAIISQPKTQAALRDAVLDRLVQEAILLNEAKRQGISVTSTQTELKLQESGVNVNEAKVLLQEQHIPYDTWLNLQRHRLIVQTLLEKKISELVPITEEEMHAYYKAHARAFRAPLEYRARQMLFSDHAEAEKALAQLKSGADFSELAKAVSQSPDAKNGGDLGWFDSDSMPSVFSDICAGLKPGQTSGVVRTDFGYQIFQLLERRPARQLSEEEASEQIIAKIREERGEKALLAWMNGLAENTKINVNRKAVDKISLAQ